MTSLLPRLFCDYGEALAALRDQAVEGAPASLLQEQAAGLWREQAARLEANPERRTPQQEREFLYALAAWTDETLLSFSWPGRDAWRGALLETRLFGSRAAGQRVFERIDALIAGPADESDAPLAAVYLMLLGLGFRGRFTAAADAGRALAGRREGLLALLTRIRPELVGRGRRTTPQAYAHTVVEGQFARLGSPHWIWAWAAGVLLIWLAGSTLAWRSLAEPVEAQLRQVDQHVARRPAASAAQEGQP